MDKGSTHPECVPTAPKIEVSNAVKDSLLLDFSVLPLAERKLQNYIDMKRLSLDKNSRLASRWRQYKDKLIHHKTSTQFPQTKDVHFYNGRVVYNPSMSTHGRPSYKYSMRPGPGTDHIGGLPIPNESFSFPSQPQRLPRKPTAIFKDKTNTRK